MAQTQFGSKTFGQKVKSFFIKSFILILVLGSFITYFLASDFGEKNGVVHDVKHKINSRIQATYDEKALSAETSIREVLGVEKKTTETVVAPEEPQKEITKANPESVKSDVKVVADKVHENTFTPLEIPFYYDHSNAPKGISKEQALATIKQASETWKEACGVSFEYKGDKFADYVDSHTVLSSKEGIIRWSTQMEGDAIGEAHVGNSKGYAEGFVLSLKADTFSQSTQDLINTITHEMGHVIGLQHSSNNRSIMFPSEDIQATLAKSDIAMCQYQRFRWNGMSKQQAEEKAGIVFNGGYKNNEE